MSEDKEPVPAAELANASEALARRMEPAIRASEMLARQMEPAIQAQERMRRQFEPMIRASEALARQFEPMIQAFERMRRHMEPILRAQEAYRQQIEPIARALEQFARIANWPKINIGPAPPYPLRLANVMDTQMRELLSPGPAAHQGSAALNVTTSASAEVAAAGGLALSPTVLVSDGDVFTLSETASVEELDSRRRGLAGLSDGEIAFLVLVWLYALVLPWFGTALPPELHAMLADGYATFAIALAITWRITDKHK